MGGGEMLGGLLAGVTVSGVMLAIFQSNAGGAWDNAKKMIEGGVTINGVDYGKGSSVHAAAVVGDTVGDPFKDTSGPSLNILLKLVSVVALVIAPWLAVKAETPPVASSCGGQKLRKQAVCDNRFAETVSGPEDSGLTFEPALVTV
jgi:K(+)-stimulated pyrophosphate-energized sodium pump